MASTPADAPGVGVGVGGHRAGESAAAPVVWVGVATTLLGFGLVLVAEASTNAVVTKAALYSGTLALGLAIFATHAAGSVRHKGSGWRNIQPGKGGAEFVALQAAGWVMYAVSLLPILLTWFYPGAAAYGVIVFGGSASVLAEVSVLVSLLFFRPAVAGAGGAGVVGSEACGFRKFAQQREAQHWWPVFIGVSRPCARLPRATRPAVRPAVPHALHPTPCILHPARSQRPAPAAALARRACLRQR